MGPLASLTLCFAVVVAADDPGFGGATETPADVPAEMPADEPVEAPIDAVDDDRPATSPAEFVGNGRAASFPDTPADVAVVRKKTALELEIEKARIDPAKYPLVQTRVEVARVVDDLKEAEKHGLASVPELRRQLAAMKAVLDDIERVALYRLNLCTTRLGMRSQTKNFKMTAAGPVRLTTQEMLATVSAVDPEGCARIEIVDAAVIARVKRAHELRRILKTTTFPFHKLDEKRALQKEQKALLAELAKEDLPTLTGGDR